MRGCDPALPEEGRYTRALSLSRLAYDLEQLASPALAAAALALVSFQMLFLANAVAFLCSALLVLSVRVPRPERVEPAAGALARITYGTRRYLATSPLRARAVRPLRLRSRSRPRGGRRRLDAGGALPALLERDLGPPRDARPRGACSRSSSP